MIYQMKMLKFLIFVGITVGCVLASEPDASTATTAAPIPAEESDPEALFLSARRYLQGDGVTRNPEKALELMLKSAESGYGPALGGVGYFYSVGLTVPQNDEEALKWFRQGAEKGVARAQYNLAQMLLVGRGTAANPSEGMEWLQKAANQDMPEALFALADAHFLEKFGVARDHDKAFYYYKRAAELGHVPAQNSLGVMYRFGQGTPTDLALAKDWFLKAANANESRAQSSLGQMYLSGIGAEQNRAEALFWLKLSARQGDATASRILDGLLPEIPSSELRAVDQRIAEWQSTAQTAIAPAIR